MSEAPKAALMQSLRRLVRGLSVLFWCLPLALLVCVEGAVGLQNNASAWLHAMGILPPVLATALLLFGVRELGHFQPQERIWQESLDRAKLLGLVNFGLSPFVFWWNRLPGELAFSVSVGLLALSGLLFLFNLNHVLQRLAAMLPDETLRADTQLFTSLNLGLMLAVLALLGVYALLDQVDSLPQLLIEFLDRLFEARRGLLVLLILLPVAMTMTLLWKMKEVVLASVFRQGE